MMSPEITMVGAMRVKEELLTCLVLLQLNSIKVHKYRNPKLKTLQKFLFAYECETVIGI